MIRANTLFILSLLPFPLLSFEFLPKQIVWSYIAVLSIRIIKEVHLAILLPIIAYLTYTLKITFSNFFLPEPMISFLALMCMTRIIARDKSDFRINRFIGILWIATFALFKSDLSYLFFMILSIFIIFKTINYAPTQRVKIIDLLKITTINLKEITIGLIIVTCLFIFFPRFYGFLPRANQTHQGKIGYSKEINNSSITNLLNSSKIAFIAETSREFSPELLYWKGRVHTKTDGHNWRSAKLAPSKSKIKINSPLEYKMKYEQDFGGDLILLDTPYKIVKTNFGYYSDNAANTYHSYVHGRKSTITATSSIKGHQTELQLKNTKKYLQLPNFLPNRFKDFVKGLNLKNKNIDHIAKMFSVSLNKNQFLYTLAPGDVTTLSKFLDLKKGYCTHYASLFAITLRYLGIPSRVVSGFQGGVYNNIGGYYTVSSNDAHAWVEVRVNNKWKRYDPTAYINPSRIRLGGEQYFSGSEFSGLQSDQKNTSSAFNYIKQLISVANYKLSSIIDNFDITQQNSISKSFKIPRKVFFTLGFLLLVILITVFYFFIGHTKTDKRDYDKIFDKFLRKCKGNGIEIFNNENLSQMKAKLNNSPKGQEIISSYEQIKYNDKKEDIAIKRLKLLVNKFNKTDLQG